MAFKTLSGMLGPTFGGKSYSSITLEAKLRNFFASRQRPQPTTVINYTAPSAPSPTPAQQTLPTSKYGDTIPVVWGICRVPGAYIWAPGFDQDAPDGVIVKTLRARIRFARPLEADSRWQMRRMWSNGSLILDRSSGYRSPLLSSWTDYDGRMTQGRDPLQVSIEGANNVSAHRGYLDIVVVMKLGPDRQPPSFDAEWIQDSETGVEVDPFESFVSNQISTNAALTGTGFWWGVSGISSSIGLLRKFNILGLHEVYSVPLSTGTGHSLEFIGGVRYIASMDRIVAGLFHPGPSGGAWPFIANPTTGVMLEAADAAAGVGAGISNTLVVDWGSNKGVYIGVAGSGILVIYTFGSPAGVDHIGKIYASGLSWDGNGDPTCFTLGEKRTSDCDIYITADDKLFKAQLTMDGALLGITELATFANDVPLAVYHDGDVLVFDDSNNLEKVDGTTGATIWTTTVPYTVGAASLRSAEPDMSVMSSEFYFQDTTNYYFTSLANGSTRTVAKTFEVSSYSFIWDESQNVVITTNNSSEPLRRLFDVVGDGELRDLEDFVSAVWEAGGYSSGEHDEIGYDDQIKGAVIDITTGTREVNRSVAAPYSIAIYESAGVVTTKRALTDGSFAVDAALTSTDFADKGGQAITATKLNPEEFIARYGVTHRAQETIYQPVTQYGEIQFTPYPVSPTDLSMKVDIPVIHNVDAMKTLATKKVQRLAEEKHDFGFTLRAKYALLEPEDVVTFDYASRTITGRLTETTINPDFTLEARATEFLSKVAATVLGAINEPTEPSEVGSPESLYYHLDIPLQEGGHDLASTGLVQYHVLTSQGQSNWDGATLYRQDGSYVPISEQIVDGLVGVALSALPDTDNPYVTEFTRTINVAFLTGDTSELETKTYLEVMNGANKFAIGAPGRWEVCHVIEIADNGDGSFAFTGLVRGRGVSEEHTGTHQIGDSVVWLSGSNVQRVEYGLAALNDAYNFKPVGDGGTLADTPAVNRTVTGEAEKIPKPCQLNASIDSPSDVHLSWVRRARYGTIWDDEGDFTTPLGETLEQYVIRIKDGPGGAVLRTITVDDATFYDYSGVMQAADFGGALSSGDDLTYDIRQVSGSGVISPTREVTVTL